MLAQLYKAVWIGYLSDATLQLCGLPGVAAGATLHQSDEAAWTDGLSDATSLLRGFTGLAT